MSTFQACNKNGIVTNKPVKQEKKTWEHFHQDKDHFIENCKSPCWEGTKRCNEKNHRIMKSNNFQKKDRKDYLHVKQRTEKDHCGTNVALMQCLNVHTQNNQTGSLKGWRHYHKCENFSIEKAFVSIIFTRCCFQYVWKQKHIQILQNENVSFHSRRELRKMDIKEITTTTNLKTGSTAEKNPLKILQKKVCVCSVDVTGREKVQVCITNVLFILGLWTDE